MSTVRKRITRYEGTVLRTFADDTAIMSTDTDIELTAERLQTVNNVVKNLDEKCVLN